MAAVGTPGGILHIIVNIPTVNAITVQKLHYTALHAVTTLHKQMIQTTAGQNLAPPSREANQHCEAVPAALAVGS
jgi:hypothetical protein